MRRLKGHIPLTRRLLGQYLMFALASVATLGAGLLLVMQAVQGRPHERAVIDLLNSTADAVARDLGTQDGRQSQHLIDRAAIEGELHYCAVVSPEGTYRYHSSRELIGRRGTSGAEPTLGAYVVERTHVSQAGEGDLVEYSKPLKHSGKTHGVLQFGVVSSQSGAWLRNLLDGAPPAMFFPFLLLLIGGKVIAGSLRTNSAVEERLAQASWLPPEAASTLTPVDDDGPVAAGWNRLTQHLQKSRPASTLEDRLEAALGGLREKRSEQALQALPEGLALTDIDGNVTVANRALCALISTDEGSIVGKALVDLLPWREAQQPSAAREAFDEPSRTAVVELKLGARLDEGVLRVARYPLTGDGGASGHAWHVRDVTQQKLAEEAREQFVYSATHELRTPLANIKAYAETLSLHDIDDIDERKRFLNTINLEATRLARFVDDLLNISQMESGSLNLRIQKSDLRRLLIETIDKVRPQMDQKSIEFAVAMPAKLPELPLDKDNMTAALVNVLGNAAKYTPDGGRVSLRVEQDESSVQIHVEDTGIGIAADEIPKLCSKFFRSSDPRVREATGTGLGLAFTQQVVRQHGGKLSIHSELNKGSRFTITLGA